MSYHKYDEYPTTYSPKTNCLLCNKLVDDFELHFLAYHISQETIKQFAPYLGLKQIEERKSVSVEAAIQILNKDAAIENELVDALLSLKAAGWKMVSNPAIAANDRKGYQITILEPKGKL